MLVENAMRLIGQDVFTERVGGIGWMDGWMRGREIEEREREGERGRGGGEGGQSKGECE